jgi:Tfp pilus assembly protein PilF
MKRTIALTFLVGAGLGLSGCQSPMLGGFSVWNKSSSVAGSTSPDVGKQKYSGLSQQVAGDAPSTGMGGSRQQPKGMLASFSKSTTAAAAALTGKKAIEPEDDPVSLNKVPKKIGAEVYVGAARLLENTGKFAEAEDKYREALRVAPTDLNAMVGLARLYDRQGQGSKAVEMYQKAGQAHPTSGLVFNDLGLCYRRQRQLDKSMAAFGKAVELVPDNAKYRNNYAAALVDAGKINEAYEQLSATGSAAVAHFNLAYLLQQKGNRPEAVRHLQEAVSIDPSLTPAREMLAQLGTSAPAASPAAEQPVPRVAAQTTAPRTADESPAPRATPPASQAPVASYSAGASENRVYTSAPQVESPAAAADSSTFHVGDDAGPVVETAQREMTPRETAPRETTQQDTTQRPTWASAAWAIPASDVPATRPLPPVD